MSQAKHKASMHDFDSNTQDPVIASALIYTYLHVHTHAKTHLWFLVLRRPASQKTAIHMDVLSHRANSAFPVLRCQVISMRVFARAHKTRTLVRLHAVFLASYVGALTPSERIDSISCAARNVCAVQCTVLYVRYVRRLVKVI